MKPKTLKLLLSLLFITASLLLFRYAGTYLVKKDPLQKSDASLILMGSIADRVLQAAVVHKQGMANEVLIVNNIQYGSEYLAQYDVFIPNFAALSKQALRQFGIPDSLITIIPGRATSTRDEARLAATWLANHPHIDTLMLISSAAHMRRAHLIFKHEFRRQGLHIHLTTSTNPYSGFNAKKWWRDRESAKQVFMEYVKISSFLLVEQWK